MKKITIPVSISSDIFVALNKSKEELKIQFQTIIAVELFKEGKLTIGKAVQLSGLNRYEFERILTDNNIPISKIPLEQVISDIDKMKDL